MYLSTSDIKTIASSVINNSTVYSGETYNCSTHSNHTVQLRKFDYSNGDPELHGLVATVWQSGANADNDGSGRHYYDSDHQSELSLGYTVNGTRTYFDADKIPYIVLPEDNNNNVSQGDVGVLINSKTGKYVYVVYADRGPAGEIGEVSMAALEGIGFNDYMVYHFGPNNNQVVYDYPIETPSATDSSNYPYISKELAWANFMLAGYTPDDIVTIMFPGVSVGSNGSVGLPTAADIASTAKPHFELLANSIL